MKSILIADCMSSVNDSGIPYGHFIHFNNDMYNVLKNNFNVSIACSKQYSNHCKGNFFIIEPSIISNSKNKFYIHIVSRIILFKKAIKVLKSKYEIIIFQQGFLPIILLALLFSNIKNKYIYIYIYSDIFSGNYLKKIIYRIIYLSAKKKINGIITTMHNLSKIYQLKSLTISDYFHRDITHSNNNNLYDVAMLGLINKWKDVESVIKSFKDTSFNILIAGEFSSSDRYNAVVNSISNNKNITIINKYLSTEEYEKYLLATRFIILPYVNSNFRSSGVFYEALYKLKPLIVSSPPPFFKLVNEYKIGLQYITSPSELIDKLNDQVLYNSMVNNIKTFLANKTHNEKEKIINFFINELEIN